MTMPAQIREFPRRDHVLWPDDMDWISDLRDIDEVKASMRDRIEKAKARDDQQMLIKIARYCREVSQAFAFLDSVALKDE